MAKKIKDSLTTKQHPLKIRKQDMEQVYSTENGPYKKSSNLPDNIERGSSEKGTPAKDVTILPIKRKTKK